MTCLPAAGSSPIEVEVEVSDGSDEDLLRRLYAEHAAALYAFCVRWTGDRQRAEDLVQEVFLRAWRNVHRVDLQQQPVRPWLIAVARNLLTDQHRARASRPVLVDEDAGSNSAAEGPDAIDRAVQSWQVAAAMQKLSAEQREVLVQAHWLGRSVGQTAAVLGIPPGTVKSRTYYAIRALRLILEEMGVGPGD